MREALLLTVCLTLAACGGGQSTGSTTPASTPAGHTFHDVVLLPDSGAFILTAAVVTGVLQVGDETFIRYDACATRGVVRIDGVHVFSGDNPFVAYCEC